MPDKPEFAESFAVELHERGRALFAAGRSEQALRCYREVVRRFGDERAPALREVVAKSLFSTALPLAVSHRVDDAIAALDDLLERFSDITAVVQRAQETRRQLVAARAGTAELRSEQEELAEAIIAHGTEAGEAGRMEEAIAAFEAVVRQFGEADYEALQAAVANAIYNHGIALRDSDRPEQAIAVFEELDRRYATAAGPSIRAQCALALFNKAVVLRDLERWAEAIAAFDETIARFSKDDASVVRERVARSLQLKSEVLWHRGRFRDAVAVRAEILRLFADATEPAIREVVTTVREEQLELLPAITPARHLETGASAEALAREHTRAARRTRWRPAIPPLVLAGLFLAEVLPLPGSPRGWLMLGLAAAGWAVFWGFMLRIAKSWDTVLDDARDIDRQQDDDAAALHADAERILAEYRQRGAPFAVFLRNFDPEARYGIGTRGRLIGVEGAERSELEHKVAAALRDRLPVVGIANPALSRPDFKHAIPKLAVDATTWRDALQRLILTADLIVIDLEHFSPGVVSELASILALGRADATVVILPSADHLPEEPHPVAEHFGLVQPEYEVPSPEHEVLTKFPHVVREDAVAFEDLDACPTFAAPLARATHAV